MRWIVQGHQRANPNASWILYVTHAWTFPQFADWFFTVMWPKNKHPYEFQLEVTASGLALSSADNLILWTIEREIP